MRRALGPDSSLPGQLDLFAWADKQQRRNGKRSARRARSAQRAKRAESDEAPRAPEAPRQRPMTHDTTALGTPSASRTSTTLFAGAGGRGATGGGSAPRHRARSARSGLAGAPGRAAPGHDSSIGASAFASSTTGAIESPSHPSLPISEARRR